MRSLPRTSSSKPFGNSSIKPYICKHSPVHSLLPKYIIHSHHISRGRCFLPVNQMCSGRLGGAQETCGNRAWLLLIPAWRCVPVPDASSPCSVSMGTCYLPGAQESLGEAQGPSGVVFCRLQSCHGERRLLRLGGKCRLRWNSPSSLYSFQNSF